jgi:hypothetical protein
MGLQRGKDEPILDPMKISSLPSENKTIQLERSHACVLFTLTESKAGKGAICPKLYVQAIDAYGFQREMSVALIHRYNVETGETVYLWEAHTYQHPGRREIAELSANVAQRFIARFLELAEKYPDLLFNVGNDRYARSSGFVTLQERIFRGVPFSVKLLD